jgi:uncharacterized repeat protein (TIGR03803 family)
VKNQLSTTTAANNVRPFFLAAGFALITLTALTSPVGAQTATTISLLPSLTTYASLVPGPAGKFYGVTNEGNIGNCGLYGCGTVFELSPSSGGTWTQTVLHVFDGFDGAWPQAGLIVDSAGNLYGTTIYGGATYGTGCLGYGCGSVFKFSLTSQGWTLTTLYSFTGGTDGSIPTTLAFGASGGLVGITQGGGSTAQCVGCGVVFQLSPDSSGTWHETRLFNFAGGPNGQGPVGLLLDSSGNIYGTAGGGNNTCYVGYCGLVFKLSHSSAGWKESVIYRFHGSDGALPNPSLIFDSAGNIYGSTSQGGTGCSSVGCGTLFRLSLKNGVWTEAVIHAFTDQLDGYAPVDGLTFDAAGNLYGGTQFANGLVQCNPFIYGACGQIFKLSPRFNSWKITAEYATPGWVTPVGDLLVDASGTVYGSAVDQLYFAGGAVFEIAP